MADYPGDLATTVEVGVGTLTVVVPDNAEVQIDARVGVGSIDAFGRSRNGYRRSLILDDQPDGAHLIKLQLRVGVGDIDVRRASVADLPFLGIPDPKFFPIADVPATRNFGDGTVLYEDGSIGFADGGRIEADGSYTIPIVEQRADGSVQLDNGAVIRADGGVVSPGGFVISRDAIEAPAVSSPTTVTSEVPQP